MLTEGLLATYLRLPTTKPSKSVLIEPAIPSKLLTKHQGLYAPSLSGKPLLMLKTFGILKPQTGLIVTDREIAFLTLKDAWLTGLLSTKGEVGTMPLADISAIQIGKADRSIGTAYLGHQLIVNGRVLGLVRMGSGAVWDSSAVNFLNGLFAFLHREGLLTAAPTDFVWQ